MNLVLFKLIAAHLLAWGFVQRRDWLPTSAHAGNRYLPAIGGAATFFALAFGVISVSSQPKMHLLSVLWLVGTTSAVRFVSDVFCTRYLRRAWSVLLGVQVFELWAISALVALAFDSGQPLGGVGIAFDSPRTYGLVATYAASLWLGGALVRLVTALLQRSEEDIVGMDGAGSIIGILERLLVTSFVLFWPQLGAAAIGLIFSAKSIARFPEMGKVNGTRFAEYYLVGTLTSFTVAIGVGMLARSYLLG